MLWCKRAAWGKILKCDLDLWLSHMHCTPSHDSEHLCYFKFLQLMKESWTRRAVLGQLDALCDLDLGLWHDTLSQCDTHFCKVVSSINDSYWTDKLFYQIWPWSATLTLDLAIQSLLNAYWLMMVIIFCLVILNQW